MPAPSDLVHETSTTTGTGNFTLSNANGKRSFNTAFGNGAPTDVFDYFISNRDAAEWERGTGHLSAASTLVRDTVHSSSNSDAAVNFSAGTKDVTNDLPALSQHWGTGLTPGGRLTLTTATPVLVSDVTAAATIYYAFHVHDKLIVFDGKIWRVVPFTELSLALDSDSGHTGYHQSGKLFDLFYSYVAGTLYFGSGAAWTNDTTRADALGRKNGIWTNNASMTLRHGSASGNTVTVPANQGTHLGTFYASANGQTEMTFRPTPAAGGTNNKLLLWNRYNRVNTAATCRESTNSWTCNAGTMRALNSSNSNRISFVRGSDDDAADVFSFGFNSQTAADYGWQGIGLDSTTAGWDGGLRHPAITNAVANNGTYSSAKGWPGLGFHYFQQLEFSAVNNLTFYGDNGDAPRQQTGIQMSMMM